MYALDIHSNSFFPLFVLLYVLQVRQRGLFVLIVLMLTYCEPTDSRKKCMVDELLMCCLHTNGFDWEHRSMTQGLQQAF